MFKKGVMNLGFDPPGSHLPHPLHWERHIHFDHYQHVIDGGGVRVAHSLDEMRSILSSLITQGNQLMAQQKSYLNQTFSITLDGQSGSRVANELIDLANNYQ